jgi:hypothetical protein
MKKAIGFLLIMAVMAGASDLYIDNENNFVTVTHSAKLDSARVRFYLDNFSNQVDSVKLIPNSNDSLSVVADSFTLAQVGQYGVKITYYPHSGGSTTFEGTIINSDYLSGSGTGNQACTLLIVDDSGLPGAPIAGAKLYAYNLAQTACRINGRPSDTNGKVFVWLDSASFVIVINSNNQEQYVDTITVNKDSTWNITMTTFSPSAPVRAGGAVLYGWTSDIMGDTVVGATFRVVPVLKSGINWKDSSGIWVLPSGGTDKSDVNGRFELEVYRSNYLTGFNWKGVATSDTLKYDIYLEKTGYTPGMLKNQYITADSTRIGD